MFRLQAGVIATFAVLALHAVPAAANPPTAFNPVVEAQNFSITQQRQAVYDTPRYQAQLAADSAASTAQALAATPPTRDASSPTTCAGTCRTDAPGTSA